MSRSYCSYRHIGVRNPSHHIVRGSQCAKRRLNQCTGSHPPIHRKRHRNRPCVRTPFVQRFHPFRQTTHTRPEHPTSPIFVQSGFSKAPAHHPLFANSVEEECFAAREHSSGDDYGTNQDGFRTSATPLPPAEGMATAQRSTNPSATAGLYLDWQKEHKPIRRKITASETCLSPVRHLLFRSHILTLHFSARTPPTSSVATAGRLSPFPTFSTVTLSSRMFRTWRA